MSQQYTEDMLEAFPGLLVATPDQQAAFMRVWSYWTGLRDALAGLAQSAVVAGDARARKDGVIVCEALKRSFPCMVILNCLRDELLLDPIDPSHLSWIRSIDNYIPKDWGANPRPEGF